MNPSSLSLEIVAEALQEKLHTLNIEYRDELTGLERDISQAKRTVRESEDAKLIDVLRKKLE